MRGLASPHPFLGAIAWTVSTSPSVPAVLFGVPVLLGSTVDSCSCDSLRAFVDISAALCAAERYKLGFLGR